MGLSRRFLNLIVDNHIPGSRSLCCVDPAQFFNTTTPNGNGSESIGPLGATFWVPSGGAGNKKMKLAVVPTLKMESLKLPSPIFNFQASCSDPNDQRKMDCFPLADRRVVCADQWGRSFLFEADTCRVVTMPRLHEPKLMPISLFIPSPDIDDRDGGGGGSLFIMERSPKPQAGNQFEAFVYRKPKVTRFSKSWDCQLLPLPPYLLDATPCHPCPEISSYGVVNDGSHIFISVEGVGTYFLDTLSHTWSEVRKWTLPFYGKVEYVPDLKLWFGLSAKAQVLAAANLSMDSKPELVGDCKEFDMPEEWKQCKDSQIVSLGSGKLCIARFFHMRTPDEDSGNELVEHNFTVLIGVEMVPHVSNSSSGKEELRMIPRKLKCHTSNGGCTIQAVF